ncbi:MAG: hypothetical protein EGQ20_16610 [Bacteroides oleiciplenus]|nr:hypothetical protein [Bacteroides oleiciplenus]
MKVAYFSLQILIMLVVNPLNAQDMPEWHSVKMDKLGFIASFYQTPTANTMNEEEATCYSFENVVNEKNHPNKLYRITVWETSNPADSTYAERKEEELTTLKLHGQGLTLIEKSVMSREAVLFKSYILQNKSGDYIHFYIGTGKNRVYTLEVICKKEAKYNADTILFIRSFAITLYNNQIRDLSIDSLSYTMNFPYTPKAQIIDSPEAGLKYRTVVYSKAAKKPQEAYMGELKVIKQESVSPIEAYTIDEIAYDIEQPEEIPMEQKSDFRKEMIHLVLESTQEGKLLKEEEMPSGNPEGVAFTFTGLNEASYRTFHCRIFYTKHALYIIQVLLRYRDEANHPDVIDFLDSFHIK